MPRQRYRHTHGTSIMVAMLATKDDFDKALADAGSKLVASIVRRLAPALAPAQSHSLWPGREALRPHRHIGYPGGRLHRDRSVTALARPEALRPLGSTAVSTAVLCAHGTPSLTSLDTLSHCEDVVR